LLDIQAASGSSSLSIVNNYTYNPSRVLIPGLTISPFPAGVTSITMSGLTATSAKPSKIYPTLAVVDSRGNIISGIRNPGGSSGIIIPLVGTLTYSTS